MPVKLASRKEYSTTTIKGVEYLHPNYGRRRKMRHLVRTNQRRTGSEGTGYQMRYRGGQVPQGESNRGGVLPEMAIDAVSESRAENLKELQNQNEELHRQAP